MAIMAEDTKEMKGPFYLGQEIIFIDARGREFYGIIVDDIDGDDDGWPIGIFEDTQGTQGERVVFWLGSCQPYEEGV